MSLGIHLMERVLSRREILKALDYHQFLLGWRVLSACFALWNEISSTTP